MIRHQAPGKDCQTVTSLHFSNKIQKPFARIHIRENRFTIREPVVHVIDPALDQKPWPPRHPLKPKGTLPHLPKILGPGTYLEKAVDQFKRRVEAMWHPELPGIEPWDIAENLSEYLALREIEKWVARNLDEWTNEKAGSRRP